MDEVTVMDIIEVAVRQALSSHPVMEAMAIVKRDDNAIRMEIGKAWIEITLTDDDESPEEKDVVYVSSPRHPGSMVGTTREYSIRDPEFINEFSMYVRSLINNLAQSLTKQRKRRKSILRRHRKDKYQ
jgi:hypothetical protein